MIFFWFFFCISWKDGNINIATSTTPSLPKNNPFGSYGALPAHMLSNLSGMPNHFGSFNNLIQPMMIHSLNLNHKNKKRKVNSSEIKVKQEPNVEH